MGLPLNISFSAQKHELSIDLPAGCADPLSVGFKFTNDPAAPVDGLKALDELVDSLSAFRDIVRYRVERTEALWKACGY